jgi:hypothetical protein
MGSKKSYNQCAESFNLNLSAIEACAAGPLGIELQLKTENASAPIISQSGHVPTITFDGKYDGKEFYNSLDDFIGVVESKLALLSAS